MTPIDLIPAPYRLLGAGLALAAAAAGAWAFVHHRESLADATGYSRGHAEYTTLQAEMARRALVAEESQRAEEARRIAAQKEIEDAHQEALQKARADAAIADAAAGRLRQRVADLIAAARSSQAGLDTSPVAGSPAACPADDLLAGVLSRAIEAAGQLATAADQSRAAGAACEAEYNSLTGTKQEVTP